MALLYTAYVVVFENYLNNNAVLSRRFITLGSAEAGVIVYPFILGRYCFIVFYILLFAQPPLGYHQFDSTSCCQPVRCFNVHRFQTSVCQLWGRVGYFPLCLSFKVRAALDTEKRGSEVH
ncbi:hypothetical protein AMECASPLE_031144 [Ameca splendens]|uniref:Uncharacterized protein n=1 Tax=Ameca splendens TaxID=208324 RepID=A0ABV0YT89_9TELE